MKIFKWKNTSPPGFGGGWELISHEKWSPRVDLPRLWGRCEAWKKGKSLLHKQRLAQKTFQDVQPLTLIVAVFFFTFGQRFVQDVECFGKSMRVISWCCKGKQPCLINTDFSLSTYMLFLQKSSNMTSSSMCNLLVCFCSCSMKCKNSSLASAVNGTRLCRRHLSTRGYDKVDDSPITDTCKKSAIRSDIPFVHEPVLTEKDFFGLLRLAKMWWKDVYRPYHCRPTTTRCV